MNRQQKKAEKFINTFCAGMDDPIMEQILRIVHLGDSEDKLQKLVQEKNEMLQEYMEHFELTDVAQTTISEEEQKSIISQHIIDTNEKNAKSDSNPSFDKGHSDISPEHPADNGISIER